jgi:hypothetical protein
MAASCAVLMPSTRATSGQRSRALTKSPGTIHTESTGALMASGSPLRSSNIPRWALSATVRSARASPWSRRNCVRSVCR